MVKKPAAAKASAAPKAAKADPSKHVINVLHSEIKTLEQQKAELKADLDRVLADCSSWAAKARELETQNQQLKRQIDLAARSENHDHNNAKAQLAHIKEVLKPFIACAKGEGMTHPDDWEALKQL